MKSIFYMLTILFLSLLIACSEEPPTNVEIESLSKKPKPPDPPPALEIYEGDVHIISVVRELKRGKYTESFRMWTYPYTADPQIRELKGTQTKVAIYNYIENSHGDELLVYNYYKTGNGRNAVEHFELQIWEHGNIEIPSLVFDLEGFLYLDIAIGELDDNYAGDEIVLGGFNMLGYPEIRIFNPNFGDFNNPIKSFNVGAYGPLGRPVIIGDVAGDADNEIIFDPTRRGLVVLDYNLGVVGTYTTPNNEQLNEIAVAYVEGEGLDEIIWGGNSGEIHILEFDGADFTEKWKSENLGGKIWSLTAGDFDGDSEYEIAVSIGDPSTIYVFESSDYSKTLIETISEGVIAMFAGNANNDPATKKNFVVGTRTSVKAYDGSSGYTSINLDVGAIVTEVYIK